MEPEVEIESTTSALQVRRSTVELLRAQNGQNDENRTHASGFTVPRSTTKLHFASEIKEHLIRFELIPRDWKSPMLAVEHHRCKIGAATAT